MCILRFAATLSISPFRRPSISSSIVNMSSIRAQALRSLLRKRYPLLRFPQKRFAQVHDVRFLATHRDPNQVLDKYREKLDQKAQQ